MTATLRSPSERGRASRAKGAAFERAVTIALRPHFPDIRRSRDNGSTVTSDTGDLIDAGPIWWSLKDDAKGDLGTPGVIDAWQREAVEKAGDWLMPMIVQKRRGHADPLRSWAWLRLSDLLPLVADPDDPALPGPAAPGVWARLELRDVLALLVSANYALDPNRRVT